jgi:hypothetical protein
MYMIQPSTQNSEETEVWYLNELLGELPRTLGKLDVCLFVLRKGITTWAREQRIDRAMGALFWEG